MIRFTTTFALVTLLLATVAAQDWNQWRGPVRSGVVKAFAAPAAWPDAPKKAWSANVGLGHASPIVSEGRAYVFSRLAEDEILTAFDYVSGKQVWQQRYPAAYTVNPAAGTHGKGPKSTPVAGGGRVFTLGINGTLSAFDAVTGKVYWRKTFERQYDATAPDFGAAMSPVWDAGVVIAHVGGNTSGAVIALNATTGTTKWQWKGDGPAYASPVIATIAGTRQVITQSRSHVVGLAAEGGTLLWKIPFATAYAQNIVTPVVQDDLVIYSGIEQPLTAVRIAYDNGTWTPRPAWKSEALPMYMTSPVLAGQHLYGLTHRNKGQFFCVDPRSGKVLWTTRGREGENAALVAAGDLLLATTTEGELVVARRDPAKFDLVKRYTIAESPVWAHPVPAGRGILIKDAEQVTYWVF
jgi:outer membrane protein assembly factor BamB